MSMESFEAEEGGGELTSEEAQERARQVLRRQLLDARELLAYATSTGRPVTDPIVNTIIAATNDGIESNGLSSDHLADFERAYRDLAVIVAPVTSVSLRATVLGSSGWTKSQRWSQRLWLVTVVSAVTLYLIETLGEILLDDDHATAQFGPYRDTFELIYLWLKGLVPFDYGLLGACAYLLRSCHAYIRERTFDPVYVPEYWNRLLLGAVAGGIILFFSDWLQNAQGTVQLSSAALAFVAGYSSDILFTLIERIKDAIIPKSPTAPARKVPAPPAPVISTGRATQGSQGPKDPVLQESPSPESGATRTERLGF